MKKNTLFSKPDANGHFENFGGRYVAETLMPMLLKVEEHFEEAWKDKNFINEFKRLLKDYAGRPSPLWHAKRLEQHFRSANNKQKGAQIFFKRDELNHTGSHKINNVIGQVLLAKRMGLNRVIAETGAGQHGVATATVAALFGMKCTVHMGSKDIQRQAPNVFRMRLLGAEIISCESGSASLKDAMNEALRDWVANVNDTYYVIGTVAGPHPYPKMVREFQKIIGEEVKEQLNDYFGNPRLPDLLIAAVGGGSNAMGLFYPFLDDASVKMVGVEAAGKGILSDKHAASISKGKPGVLHGNKTYLLQDDEGQIIEAHSVSAGLDYPGIGPEHSWLHEAGRVKYEAINDDEAIEAFQLCCRLEGIIPALEPSHALGYLAKVAGNMKREEIIVMNMCGRGDKDIFTVAELLDEKLK